MKCVRLLIATTFTIVVELSLLAQVPVNIGDTPPPRVNADLSVTYFLNAPDAKEVRLGDTVFAPDPPGIPLTKGPDGMWSVTTPPYELGTHNFGFVVDGVLTGDMGGTAHTERLPLGYLLFEQLDVRGPDPLVTDVRQVPHGTVHIETFTSATLSREVRCFVYTPPQFVTGERLPVVYLFQIDADFDGTWSAIGYAERIADNLIAMGQARRAILVLPAGNRDNLPAAVMDTYLISEVIPFVESKYLIQPATERYLAGHSSGALYARNAGLRNPSMFAGLGLFSGGGLPAGRALEDIFPLLTQQPGLFSKMKPIYIAIGNEDAALSNVQRLSESLDRLGVTNTLSLTSGGHTWFNWRRYLSEFLKSI
jgi:enterochelin esterase-like enzyme